MFGHIELFPDIATDMIVVFELDIFSHLLATKTDGIQAHIVDFGFVQSVLLKIFNKRWMRVHEHQSGGVHELVLVLVDGLNPFVVWLGVGIIVRYLFCQKTIEHV